MPLRTALLEVNHWHTGMYAEALKNLGVPVAAVSDADIHRAREWADQIGCRAYDCPQELLDKEQVDFVFALAPHHRMFALASMLAKRAQPFSMEKPMALKAERLAELVEPIERVGMFAGVAFVRRLSGYGKALLDRREQIGAVCHFQGRFIGGPMQRYVEDGCPWMLDKREAGGGCMMNFGTHFFDLFIEMTGERVDRVFCQTSRRLHGASAEDFSSVLLKTESGALATLESGYLLPGEPKENMISVSGANAYAGNEGARWGEKPVIAYRNGKTERITDPEPNYADYTADVLRRFQADEKPLADIRAMTRVLACINAAYESDETGKPAQPSCWI